MRSFYFTLFTFFLTPIAIADTEPNDTWQTATTLLQDTSVTGTQSEVDWYVINAAAGNRILIDLTFTHADGDIDVGFFDNLNNGPQFPGTLIANSVTNNSDHEFVSSNIPAPDTYYIQVYGGAGGDQGNSYTLTWTEIGADDGFEENDDNANTAAITESTVAFGSQSDEDWYSINAAADGTQMLVSLRFNADDDLDLELRDAGGTLLDSSMNGLGINEAIDFTVATMGTYHLRVTGNNSGDGYAIDWEGIVPVVNPAPTPAPTTLPTDGGSSGSISLVWLFALMLVGLARRVHR